MVQVKSIAEMGAYVSLLEYNGIEGMILLSELSRRRIRSITKLIKVGASGSQARRHPCMGGGDGASVAAAKLSLPFADSGRLSPLCRQVGRQEPVMVLRVDKEKGYIDLSKRCEKRRSRLAADRT